jgi:integration host factor subunit beta
MHKSQLVNSLVDEAKVKHGQAETVVDIFFNAIEEALMNGERTELRGLGVFNVKVHMPYTGRNPKTGELIEVPFKKVPFFKAGLELKTAVAKSGKGHSKDKSLVF